jgi:hypothetical protein
MDFFHHLNKNLNPFMTKEGVQLLCFPYFVEISNKYQDYIKVC